MKAPPHAQLSVSGFYTIFAPPHKRKTTEMSTPIPQLLIAAPSSGSGKTTISRGLMALLREKGYKTQPYKCGPDYIDTMFHHQICGQPSVNLDTFLSGDDHVRQLYARHAQGKDACIAEGMMGLFDGYWRDLGSSAHVARLLHLPVVLVVNARSAAYSTAALLTGLARFDERLDIAGVIFNQTGRGRHEQMLRDACRVAGLECLGCLPRLDALKQESRYLGLDFSQIHATEGPQLLASLVEQHIDWQRLLDKTRRPRPQAPARQQPKPMERRLNITVFRDEEAFSFLYAERLEELELKGRVTYIDPRQDRELPADTDYLYLPGGYPEKHIETLTRAQHTLRSVRQYVEDGGQTLAECGGMIYLSQGLLTALPADSSPRLYPLAGVLPFTISDQPQHRRLSIGYRIAYPRNGSEVRGHEFHYTQLVPGSLRSNDALKFIEMRDVNGHPVPSPIYQYRNTTASYLHYLQTPPL